MKRRTAVVALAALVAGACGGSSGPSAATEAARQVGQTSYDDLAGELQALLVP